jgi:hypothetical protein
VDLDNPVSLGVQPWQQLGRAWGRGYLHKLLAFRMLICRLSVHNNMADKRIADEEPKTQRPKRPKPSSTDPVDEGTGNPEQGRPTVEAQLSTHPATCTVQEAIDRVRAHGEELKKRFHEWQKDGNSSPPSYGLS